MRPLRLWISRRSKIAASRSRSLDQFTSGNLAIVAYVVHLLVPALNALDAVTVLGMRSGVCARGMRSVSAQGSTI